MRGETPGDGESCRREDIAGGNTLYLRAFFGVKEELEPVYSIWVMGLDSYMYVRS